MKPKTKTTGVSLRDALIAQPLFGHNIVIVDWLIGEGVKIERVEAGTILIKENNFDNRDVFCIVSGSFNIDVGGHFIRTREKNIHIGEMAMILDEGRTASAIAAENSSVVRIPQATMDQLYSKFPETWKPVAQTLCERLHQRKKFFRVKNAIPKVFLGSSGASLSVAKRLASKLRANFRGEAIFEVWNGDPIFTPSSVTINQLIERAKTSDFGIFIFAADDEAKVKKKTVKVVPRDNVIFEGGLFTAACGLNRTIFVCEKVDNLHIPTDLAGVTVLKFSRNTLGNKIQFGDTVRKIAAIIRDLKEI